MLQAIFVNRLCQRGIFGQSPEHGDTDPAGLLSSGATDHDGTVKFTGLSDLCHVRHLSGHALSPCNYAVAKRIHHDNRNCHS